MKRLIFILTILMALNSQAQQYSTAIGLKGGYAFQGGGGINLKHFLGGSSAVEATLGGGTNTIWIQGLYERNQNLSHDFEWYYGFGGNLGLRKLDSNTNLILGADAVLGLEYTFDDFPLNLAVDTGPSIIIVSDFDFGWGGRFAVRYAF